MQTKTNRFYLIGIVTCAVFGAALIGFTPMAPAAQALQPSAAAAVVSFDGTGFEPAVVSVMAGTEIALRNDTNQDRVLSVRSGAPANALPPVVFLPLLRQSTLENRGAVQATTASELTFPARSTIDLDLGGSGDWTVALAGEEGVALAVYIIAPPTPTPTPTATPTPPGQKEWTLHKTSDGIHPDGAEQQMVWLMNRARANPRQEGLWLATTGEPDIAGPRQYFDVDTTVLQNEFNSYAAKAPAAFDRRLYLAAQAHSAALIARDSQDHDGQFEQVAAAGFNCAGGRGNVFAYTDSSLGAHGAFNIDWGGGSDGMQPGRGHRKAIMALDGDYTNVGLALVPDNNPNTSVGPLVTTGNYCRAGSGTDHHNRFLVGTVWSDSDGDGLYDPGEGIGDVRVTPSRGDFFAVTGAAGGFAIPITSAGDYTVRFDVGGGQERSVSVGERSVLLDLLVAAGAASPPAASGEEKPTTATPQVPGPPLVMPPHPTAP